MYVTHHSYMRHLFTILAKHKCINNTRPFTPLHHLHVDNSTLIEHLGDCFIYAQLSVLVGKKKIPNNKIRS